MTQYDGIGEDLRTLVQEWESGRAALTQCPSSEAKRSSQVSEGPRSPVLSLDGSTATESGSPSDALRALNGDDTPRSSLELSSLDNEEVFEAVALPRQRTSLTREERISKMRAERARAASVREAAQAQTNMIRELQSVISLRPRTKTTTMANKSLSGSRVTSI